MKRDCKHTFPEPPRDPKSNEPFFTIEKVGFSGEWKAGKTIWITFNKETHGDGKTHIKSTERIPKQRIKMKNSHLDNIKKFAYIKLKAAYPHANLTEVDDMAVINVRLENGTHLRVKIEDISDDLYGEG